MLTDTEQQKNVPNLRFPAFSGEWEEKRLGDLLMTVVDNRGKTPPISSHGIPLVETNALGNRYIKYSQVNKFVSDEIYHDWFRSYLEPQDILFSTVGRTAICSIYEAESTTAIAQNIVGLRFKNQEPYFMHYLLTEDRNNHKFKRIEMGAVQPSVKVSQMIDIKFRVPTFVEQKKIADFISNVDKWIENLKDQKTKLEEYKRGMMQKIFSQEVRFKPACSEASGEGWDENGNKFPEWEETKLGQIATYSKGAALSKAEILEDGKNKCIHYGELFTKYSELVTEIYSRTNVDPSISKLSKKNDILMPTSDVTPNGLATASALSEEGVILGGDVLVIRSETLNNVFFAHYISAHKKDVMKLVQGVTVYHLYGSHLAKMTIGYPTLEEQNKIADFISSLDALVEAKDQQITKAETWKKGLLQKMFV